MSPIVVVGIVALGAFIFRKPKPPPPANPNVRPLPGSSRRPKFAELTVTSPITYPVGETWLLEADVPFFAESLVTESKIREGLRERGLLPLRVSSTRPDYWPVLSEADWYVLVTNTDRTKPIELPSAVERIWKATA